MISDPLELQRITNKAICFKCMKVVDIDNLYYELSLGKYKTGFHRCLSSIETTTLTNNYTAGTGSILRFHVECFLECAGEEFCFDQDIWK